MNPSDLLVIANDICAAANLEFSKKNIRTDYKWIVTTLDEEDEIKSKDLVPIKLIEFTVSLIAYALKDYPVYIKLIEYIETIENIDSVKKEKDLFDGQYHFSQLSWFTKKLIEAAFLEGYFHPTQLINELNTLTTIIASKVQEVTIVGRVHGLKLEVDLIEINPDISLICLNKEGINQRQPEIIMSSISSSYTIVDYSDSNIEIKIKDVFQIDIENHKLIEDIKSKLDLKLKNVINAIKLHCHGKFEIYPILYYSSLTGKMQKSGSLMSNNSELMHINKKATLNNADIDNLKKAFSIVESISQDSVLERSLSRFLIGLDEYTPEEQLVDFVIAWESILQTVNSTSNKSELAYRFSLNGAAILCAVDNTREFTQTQMFMKEIYNMRSTIVHGGDSNSISKNLNKTKFNKLYFLNKELAELYRKVIFWLATLTKEERPYHKNFGWELLLRQPND